MAAVAEDNRIRDRLTSSLQALELQADATQVEALISYVGLLSRWNRAYNLTAVREPLEMVSRHILDSLAVMPLLPAGAQRIADIGTGGGLPGVPLAILNPERQFDLVDGNGKKARFLFQVKTELGLANMASHHSRVEAWQPAQPCDVVLSRAFASLADMVDCCAHLVSGEGVMLAMKGQYPAQELEQLPGGVVVTAVHRLEVPGLSEQRHVVEIRPGDPSRQKNETDEIIG